MAKAVTVLIRQDPRTTHKPVEALRIALGLSAGDHAVSVLLFNKAPLLLTDDVEDVIDVEILEKYLPSLKEIGVQFFIPESLAPSFSFQKDFIVTELSVPLMRKLIEGSDCVLAF